MISKPYIKLKNVSKVFGQNPDTVIDLVQIILIKLNFKMIIIMLLAYRI